jgi:hypothetical protein
MQAIKPVSGPRQYVDPSQREFVGFDTETALIEDHLPVPPLACLTTFVQSQSYIVNQVDARPFARELFKYALDRPHVTLTSHHTAYDTSEIAYNDPNDETVGMIFDLYDRGQFEDSLLTEKLSDIARGNYDQKKKGRWLSVHGQERRLYRYGLDECVFVRCGLKVDKSDDTWRMRYGQLINVPVAQWPEAARRYALDDPRYHWLLRMQQEHDEANDPQAAYVYADAGAQARAGFALQLARAWGICTDARQTTRMIDILRERQSKIMDDLIALGFVTPPKWRPRAKDWTKPKKNTKIVKAYVERVCLANGVEIPRVDDEDDESSVTFKAAAIEELGEKLPNNADVAKLMKIVEFGKTQKLLGYTEILRSGFEHPIHSEPNTLIANGRISWGSDSPDGADSPRKVNLTNLPRDPGIRECYIPHGVRFTPERSYERYFFSVDYSQLELCTVGQVQLWELGRSTIAELINADVDLHNRLSVMFLSLQGIHVTEAEFESLRKDERPILFGLSAEKVRDASKRANFGFWGGMGVDRFQSANRELKLPDEAVHVLKDAWRGAYPEEKEYFKDAAAIEKGSGTYVQLTSNRVRGGMGYSDAANTKFSGLAADGAKDALYRITRACYADRLSPAYGSRINAFIHDEFFGEVFATVAHEAATEIARLARLTMQLRIPDVKIKTSLALSLRWRKGAKTYYDDTGRLQPFEYSPKFAELVAAGKMVPEYA